RYGCYYSCAGISSYNDVEIQNETTYMKVLLAMLFSFIPLHLFSQIDTKHLEEYKELIFNVQNEHSNSIGTAFVVGKNDSHYFLATAKHVLNGSREAILTSLDGGQYNASLVAEHD